MFELASSQTKMVERGCGSSVLRADAPEKFSVFTCNLIGELGFYLIRNCILYEIELVAERFPI